MSYGCLFGNYDRIFINYGILFRNYDRIFVSYTFLFMNYGKLFMNNSFIFGSYLRILERKCCFYAKNEVFFRRKGGFDEGYVSSAEGYYEMAAATIM